MSSHDVELGSPGTRDHGERHTSVEDKDTVAIEVVAIGVWLVFGTLLGVGLGVAFMRTYSSIVILSTTIKEPWLEAIIPVFNSLEFKTTEGKVMKVGSVKYLGSTFYPNEEPTIFSPASQVWVEIANSNWTKSYSQPLVFGSDCPTSTNIPAGVLMWRVMATKLGWPNRTITWVDILNLATSPIGWRSVDDASPWGSFKFGHAHPRYANSGRVSVLAQVHSFSGKFQSALAVDDLWVNSTVSSITGVQRAIYHYGKLNTDVINKMASNGVNYLHAVTAYESDVVRYNVEKGTDFVFVYLTNGTFWNQDPMCVCEGAPWVDSQMIETGKKFVSWSMEPDQQATMLTLGLRPARSDVRPDAPGSLLTPQYGVITDVTFDSIGSLPTPSPEVMTASLDLFYLTKKPSIVYLVIDTSLSMEGDPLAGMKTGAKRFISNMRDHDNLTIVTFSSTIYTRYSGKLADSRSVATSTIDGLNSIGATVLYDATATTYNQISRIRSQNIAAGQSFNYAIVLMTDGSDTSSLSYTRDTMFAVFPSGEDATAIHVYTIAFGADADKETLSLISNRTNGKFFEATTSSISDVYFAINAEV